METWKKRVRSKAFKSFENPSYLSVLRSRINNLGENDRKSLGVNDKLVLARKEKKVLGFGEKDKQALVRIKTNLGENDKQVLVRIKDRPW